MALTLEKPSVRCRDACRGGRLCHWATNMAMIITLLVLLVPFLLESSPEVIDLAGYTEPLVVDGLLDLAKKDGLTPGLRDLLIAVQKLCSKLVNGVGVNPMKRRSEDRNRHRWMIARDNEQLLAVKGEVAPND